MASGSAAWAGVVQITSQQRVVEVEYRESGEGGGADQTDREAAPDAGPFTGQARVRRTGTNFDNTVSAGMQSDLDGSVWRFRGAVDIDHIDQRDAVNPVSNARFTAIVEFMHDAPFRYELDGGPTASGSGQSTGQLAEMIEGVSPGAPSPGTDRAGTLPAGTYRLTLAQEIESIERNSDVRSDLDYTFTLNAVNDGGNGGTPPAVPLPPAVWAGLITMGATGLTGAVRRRFRRA